MTILTIDFETYYDSDVTLSKLTIEEYINHPKFEVIGMGVKADDHPLTLFFSGQDVKKFLDNIDFSNTAIICHNAMFDATVLSMHYGIHPMFIMDTMGMAKALRHNRVSLAHLAEYYHIGRKDLTALSSIQGLRTSEITSSKMNDVAEYCKTDVELTYKLYNIFAPKIPDDEMRLMDLTIRMNTDPQLMLDCNVIKNRQGELQAIREKLIDDVVPHIGLAELKECSTEFKETMVLITIRSDAKFAELLSKLGITPPTKINSKGEVKFAFAKSDKAFTDLENHDDPRVAALCSLRLKEKSTIEGSRLERFSKIAARNSNYLPIPLTYYGTHTGRWAGADKINLQNLPSRDKGKKALKNAIISKPGHTIIESDSSQIEARVLAWLAGQDDLLAQFACGEDVYSLFAAKIYGYPVSKDNPVERFVGKTCILGLGYGTGAEKLQTTLANSNPPVNIPLEQAKYIVNLYRKDNAAIPALWRISHHALSRLLVGRLTNTVIPIGKHDAVFADSEGICLPNGLYLKYPELELSDGQYSYLSMSYGKTRKLIWGGAVVENIVQALARIIIGHQILKISERYRVAMTVHDSVVVSVPDEEVDTAVAFVRQQMSTPPDWCATLPLACEVKIGKSYGELSVSK